VLKILRHDDWDVSEVYQRIDDVVPLKSSPLVPLGRTVDHVIVGGKGKSTFMRNSLDVCVAALDLIMISDVRDGGQNEIPCYQASQRGQPNAPFLAAPPGTRPAVDQIFEVRWLQSRGRR
jgi:hypothetical protein